MRLTPHWRREQWSEHCRNSQTVRNQCQNTDGSECTSHVVEASCLAMFVIMRIGPEMHFHCTSACMQNYNSKVSAIAPPEPQLTSGDP